MKRKVSRRQVVKRAIAAGAVATALPSDGAPSAATSPATTRSASTTQASTTQASAITPDDVAAFERISGRAFTEAERKMTAGRLGEVRATLRRVRGGTIGPDVEPAIRFDPRPPGFVMPTMAEAIEPSEREVAYDGNPASLAQASAAELSRLIAARRITSVQLTTMYLQRLKRIGPRLNCVITLTEELALRQAERADRELAAGKSRGPLHGIPWGAKDLLATNGVRTTWGAAPYLQQVFDDDADVVKRLEAAGAVLVAKLSLGELAMGDVWYNGLTHNPWKPKEGSSGSSAGPAAATAAGLCGFTIGSETLGSIVSPSVRCGVTGLRTTYGAVSRRGAMPLARTMDKLGPICRGVEDCALVYHAIRDPGVPFAWTPAKGLQGVRVGIYQPAIDGVKDAARAKLYAAAVEALAKLAGGELKPVSLPAAGRYNGLPWLFIAAESAANFSELLDSGHARELRQQDPGSWPNSFRVGSTIPAADYLRAMQLRALLIEQMANAMRDVDVFVTVPFAGPVLNFTNLTGHPSLIMRCGVIDGAPLSIELIGQLYREDVLLRVGHALERQIAPRAQWPDAEGIPELKE
jgi:Asp-tRNA(Asn)/Glu-tRNA(Gln) amidotransferase A subunit family amidase